MSKNQAFSLAEVLITLGIIGVVAALTIPSLMKNTQDTELKTAWKKEFSTFSQAYIKFKTDNGTGLISWYPDDASVRDALGNYLQYTKTCEMGRGDNLDYGGCWHYMDNTSKCINGNAGPINWWSGDVGAVLADGTLVTFWDKGLLFIDVNGRKGPNTVGKDIFGIAFDDNKMYPSLDAITPYNASSSSNGGTACGWGNGTAYLMGN